ncbi:carboxypeptidase regulatory-like domain-containing protein, partial [bacterium]|nr:carboxypeptidase regulatory-like domain-containing protein [bacterium]
MTSLTRVAFTCFTAFSLAGTLSGCGGSSDTPDLGSVSGTVTIDGAPASNVTVTFTPVEGGRASTGTTSSSGHYNLVYSPSEAGAVLGQHKVTIRELKLDFDESTPESE